MEGRLWHTSGGNITEDEDRALMFGYYTPDFIRPQLEKLKSKYPDVTFTGPKFGEELAAHYRSGDVFVFPSKTDTFGLVMLEATACGLPVDAYPVTGPLDVLADCTAGEMNEDLAKAVKQALTADSQAARDHALKFSWEACTKIFLSNLTPL